jgi:hypothetical protein
LTPRSHAAMFAVMDAATLMISLVAAFLIARMLRAGLGRSRSP